MEGTRLRSMAGRLLPVRLRQWYWRRIFVSLSRRVTATMPCPCESGARTEIHTVIGRRGVYLYLAAIKSLLRFDRSVAVAVHDDGSLSRKEIALLEHHVPGVRVLARAAADERMERVLAGYPRCAAYRQASLMGVQLFDYTMMSEAEKIVSLDSDTLFLARPDQFIDWIADGGADVLYSVQDDPWDPTGLIARNGGGCGLNAGFVGYARRLVQLPLIERILENEPEFTWWTGQSCFNVLFRPSETTTVEPLDPAVYQHINKMTAGAAFRHYFGSSGAAKVYGQDLREVMTMLSSSCVDGERGDLRHGGAGHAETSAGAGSKPIRH